MAGPARRLLGKQLDDHSAERNAGGHERRARRHPGNRHQPGSMLDFLALAVMLGKHRIDVDKPLTAELILGQVGANLSHAIEPCGRRANLPPFSPMRRINPAIRLPKQTAGLTRRLTTAVVLT
jgi:hypothetical protein